MADHLVLVTGATGLVGNNVTRLLLEQGYAVRLLVRKTSDRRALDGLSVQEVEGDVCDADSVRRACDGVTCVIHSAGYVQLGRAHLDRHRNVNVVGTRNVAAAARDVGARLIHVSSTDVLGSQSLDTPADEDTPLPPPGPCAYVITKREAEEAVRAEIDQGLDAVIVNPSFMLGPWDWKPSSGRMLLAVANGTALMAPRGQYSVADVRDVAAGIVAAMQRGTRAGRYILAGANLSYLDAWRKFAEVTDARKPLCAAPPFLAAIAGWGGDLWGRLTGHEPDVNSAAIALAKAPKSYTCVKAQRELDYRNRPLEETIRDAWDWLVEHGYARRRK
jgi:dihydroflavonol-4-reductase